MARASQNMLLIFLGQFFFSFSEKKLKDTDSLMIPLFPPLLSLSHFPVS